MSSSEESNPVGEESDGGGSTEERNKGDGGQGGQGSRGKRDSTNGPRGSGRRGKQRRSKAMSRSEKADIVFPVGRVDRYLKKGKYAERVGVEAPVYLAAVLEYLAAELLEMAGTIALANKKMRITPRYIQLAINSDPELKKLMESTIIPSGGVTPHIENALLPKERGE